MLPGAHVASVRFPANEKIGAKREPIPRRQRHLVSRSTLRIFRAEAANQWRDAVAVARSRMQVGLVLAHHRLT
jgi:hypothetical protein